MKTLTRYALLSIVIATLAGSAFADAIFTLGNHPQPNEENILFKSDQSASTVNGWTNQSNQMVQFSSTTDTEVAKSHGQAEITAVDGFVNDVTISVPGFYFQDFILNPFKPGVDGDLIVTVTMSDGSTYSFGPYGDKHGNNFLTITTINNEWIKSVTIDSASGFQDLKQPRISGVAAVPEPSSLALLGSGALGLAAWLRRKMFG